MTTDLEQASRFITSAPGFTLLIASVLAIGVAAITSIFSVVNGVLLEPLAFPQAARFVAIQSETPGDSGGSASGRRCGACASEAGNAGRSGGGAPD